MRDLLDVVVSNVWISVCALESRVHTTSSPSIVHGEKTFLDFWLMMAVRQDLSRTAAAQINLFGPSASLTPRNQHVQRFISTVVGSAFSTVVCGSRPFLSSTAMAAKPAEAKIQDVS